MYCWGKFGRSKFQTINVRMSDDTRMALPRVHQREWTVLGIDIWRACPGGVRQRLHSIPPKPSPVFLICLSLCTLFYETPPPPARFDITPATSPGWILGVWGGCSASQSHVQIQKQHQCSGAQCQPRPIRHAQKLPSHQDVQVVFFCDGAQQF